MNASELLTNVGSQMNAGVLKQHRVDVKSTSY